MIVENRICPYPGLRPFNEEESIFFKGRDEHITQIVHQLEKKKFLMITGASGDGKSSLVYAGVIPQARAGFFKAKFNNWVVADFRPERTPLKNMAASLNNTLGLHDEAKTEKELSYGFSALIDLYQSSAHWIDQATPEFIALDETEKKKRKRKGANLLILVDQFEEFFTNAENYAHGKPSFQSQAVINVLLETAKIALEQDIPIYIACTMRSDYIGQCASFRNLPEYIGFSQFFVPRLNRQEIYQVIEEPAILNGDKISKRLVETFISQLDEGVDQLPVLQHALNQVWQTASDGTQEMDLLHLAKIGGLNKKYLNPTDRKIFEAWLSQLPAYKKPFYENPSLDNVLDTHANELFEVAAKRVNSQHTKEKIVDADAKKIIETSFKCLTKIDEGRAVRNRMTLQEIVNIINDRTLDTKIVGEVLDIYRVQGNTFLKPFITDDEQTAVLKPDSILDITHESLIRNWTILGEWTKEEHEDVQNFQDFSNQLQRWVKHNKSSDYLLPIGPLNFFEGWFHKTKPTKYWLVKYDDRDINREQKLTEAEETLGSANEFLKRSARRLVVNRTILKYGADKIIAGFGMLLLIVSCAYFTYDYRTKQNDYVIKVIEERGSYLLKSKYVESKIKADYIFAEEKLHPGIYKTLLNDIESDSLKLDIIKTMIVPCFQFEFGEKKAEADNALLGTLFLHQLELINKNKPFSTDSIWAKNIDNLSRIIHEHILIKRGNYKQNAEKIEELYNNYCNNAFHATISLLNDTSALKKINISVLDNIFEILPDLAHYDSSKLRKTVEQIAELNKKNKHIIRRENDNFYFALANLYALIGDFDNLSRSCDSVFKYNKDFIYTQNKHSYIELLYDLILTHNFTNDTCLQFMKKIKSLLTDKNEFALFFSIKDNLAAYAYSPYQIRYNIDRPGINMNQKYLIDSSETIDVLNYLIGQIKLSKESETNKKYMVDLFEKSKSGYTYTFWKDPPPSNSSQFNYKWNALLFFIDSLQNIRDEVLATRFTDSFLNNHVAIEHKYGNKIFNILGRFNTTATTKIALNLMKDESDETKPDCLKRFIKGLANSDNYYSAFTNIPDNTSSQSQINLYIIILKDKIQRDTNIPNMIDRDNIYVNRYDGEYETVNTGNNILY